MRALLCEAYGPIASLRLAYAPSPIPQHDQVVIRVAACGINFPDALIVQGKYQFKPDLPFSPGSDVSGVVTAVGAGVRAFAPGDRVLALAGWGGLREEVALDARVVMPAPDGVDLVTAAAIPMVYGTAWHALKDRAGLRPGETLLVLGAAGGVGLAGVQLGKAVGATVIAAASSPEKLACCRENGADHLIDYTREDLRARLKEIAGPNGVDVVLDPVGGAFSEPAFRALGWKGRHLVVGFADGAIPALPLNLPLLKGAALVGVFWGQFARVEPEANRDNFREIAAMLADGRIRPVVSQTFPLERAADAIAAVAERRAIGKVVVTMA